MDAIKQMRSRNIYILSIIFSLFVVPTAFAQEPNAACPDMIKLKISQIGAIEILLKRQQSELHYLAETHMSALAGANKGGSTRVARRMSRERQSLMDRQACERAELMREQSEMRAQIKCRDLAPNLAFMSEAPVSLFMG